MPYAGVDAPNLSKSPSKRKHLMAAVHRLETPTKVVTDIYFRCIRKSFSVPSVPRFKENLCPGSVRLSIVILCLY